MCVRVCVWVSSARKRHLPAGSCPSPLKGPGPSITHLAGLLSAGTQGRGLRAATLRGVSPGPGIRDRRAGQRGRSAGATAQAGGQGRCPNPCAVTSALGALVEDVCSSLTGTVLSCALNPSPVSGLGLRAGFQSCPRAVGRSVLRQSDETGVSAGVAECVWGTHRAALGHFTP